MKSSNPTSNIKTLITDNEALKAIVVELQETVVGLEATLADKNVDIHLLTEKLNLIKALLHARRSEKKLASKIDPKQMSLFDEAEATSSEETDETSTEQTPTDKTTTVAGHTRTKKGRRPLPAHIPREDVICDIAEKDKVCPCGCRLKRFGEEVSEKLDIIPQTIRVIRTIRPKYACPKCEGTEDDVSVL